ncbi:MAG: efflux RND transporter periplasmic adaptor subunit [Alphaproteobacteria bacterium]
MRKVLWILGLLLILAGGGGGAWWQWGRAPAEAERYVTAKVTRGNIEQTISAQGTLQPMEYVDVGTQVSGQLRKIHVQIGDVVAAGDLLAEIDPTLYRARVASAQAQLQNLRAMLTEKRAQRALARQQFERQDRLLRANATSQDAFQSSETAVKAAEAQIAAIEAQIQQTQSSLEGDEANLGYTRIHAPMSGTVVTLPARQGQTINASQQAPIILRIASLDTMTVWSQVSEADINNLRLGMDVYFTTLGEPDRRRRGTLRQILPSPEVLNNVVLYNALFDVPNETRDLRIQMSAQVFFVLAEAKDTLLVPAAALQAGARGTKRTTPANEPGKGPGKGTVRVLRDGAVESRSVTVGVSDRVRTQILSGLEEGDEVIVGSRETASKPAGAGGGGGGGGKMGGGGGGQPSGYRPRI